MRGAAYANVGFRKLRRFLRPPTRSGAVLLLYHRVASERVDPWRLCVSPETFAEQLQILRSSRVNLLPLDRIVTLLASRSLPPRTVGITFDDGYADNYLAAAPLLHRFDAPATVFVTTDHIDSVEEFWWDTLERIFLQPGELPHVLELVIRGEPRRWNLGRASEVPANVASSTG